MAEGPLPLMQEPTASCVVTLGCSGVGRDPSDAVFSNVEAEAEHHTVWVVTGLLTSSSWEGDCHRKKYLHFTLERCSQQESVLAFAFWFGFHLSFPSRLQNAPQ